MAADDDLAPSLTVTGKGKASAPPDMAEVHAGVTTQADSAAAALEQNSADMAKLLDVAREQGIAKKDIQTSQFRIAPRYQQDPKHKQTNEIVGYQVTNQVRITVGDLDALGALLDKVVAAGANQVHGINFSIAEPEHLLDRARREAMADARRKAELYAKAGDVRLGRTLLIQEGAARVPQPRPVRYFSEARAASAPIAQGELDFMVSIQITYRLE
jgi:uncharacterized protein YggE